MRLLALLVELNRMGKTVLVATHDPNLVRAAQGAGRGAGAAPRRRPGARRRRSAGVRPAAAALAWLRGDRRRRPGAAARAGRGGWRSACSRRSSASSRCWRWRWRSPPGGWRRPGRARSPTPRRCRSSRRRTRSRSRRARRSNVLRDHAGRALGADGRPRRAGAAARALARARHPDREPAAAADDRGRDRPRRALDRAALVLRLAAEAPGAVFDDHAAWRAAAGRHRRAAAALRARRPRAAGAGAGGGARRWPRRRRSRRTGAVIETLRLVGARDGFIARRLHPALRPARAAPARRVGHRAPAMLLLGAAAAGERAGVLPGRHRPRRLAVAAAARGAGGGGADRLGRRPRRRRGAACARWS